LHFSNRIFGWLPEYDREICRLYAQGLTQKQIGDLLPLKQPEVSGRLNSCLKLLVFLFDRPTLDPVQARADLAVLLPEHLLTVALLLYLELSPTRVAECSGSATAPHGIDVKRLWPAWRNWLPFHPTAPTTGTSSQVFS